MHTKIPADSGRSPDNDTDSSSPTVVILYDDLPAGQHAIQVLKNMFGKAGSEFELLPQLWRFESVEDPDWFAVSLAEASGADIVVIATSSLQELNDSVKRWITLCLNRKQGTSAAIVALLGPAEKMDEPGSPRFQFLRDASRKAGLDFFAPKPGTEH